MKPETLEFIPNITYQVTLQIQLDATDYPDADSVQGAITSALDPIGIVAKLMTVNEK